MADLRSRRWFSDPANPAMTALYIERYMNYGLTREELQSGKPIIGIAQTGSDLSPCNRHHLQLADRVREGIREAGGIAMEFPVHPIQETSRRPTAALDRNLSYLGMVEVLHGYPIDGVVFTIGCDKTTPAALMAAATVDIPSITLSGGPMLNGWWRGERVGSGTSAWRAMQMLESGEIDEAEYIEIIAASTPSVGFCNTMGTASTMNNLAEALGMQLPGSASIPAPRRERAQSAYFTGLRIVEMVNEDLRPSAIMTRRAFENAIRLCSAIGGSTNAVIHINAIARHAGIDIGMEDWERVGHSIPLLTNVQPAGTYLAEDYWRAGGAEAVIGALLRAGMYDGDALTVTGKSVGELYREAKSADTDIIREVDMAFAQHAGMLVLSGNLFDSAIMKTSVISDEFRARYLSDPERPNVMDLRAVVFDGLSDYRARIDDPVLEIDDRCLLVMRLAGPLGFPGSGEVVNMRPPKYLIEKGVTSLPCLGDGRQSGTSDAPSILNASPEAAAGGGLAWLRTGDIVRIDLDRRRVDALVDSAEWQMRQTGAAPIAPVPQTPWQAIQAGLITDLASGMVLSGANDFHGVGSIDALPGHGH
jgi:dihydroxy-acid dehydratase